MSSESSVTLYACVQDTLEFHVSSLTETTFFILLELLDCECVLPAYLGEL